MDTRAKRKPRICILADQKGWAYDNSARQIRDHLAAEFDVTIHYEAEDARVSGRDYDLLHVCFWGAEGYKAFGFDPRRIIKEVSSHRWQDDPNYGPLTPSGFATRYLADCDTAICTSRRLGDTLAGVFPRVFHTANGIDAALFRPFGRNTAGSRLVFGWAGNAGNELKGFSDIVAPACADRFPLLSATGGMPHDQMPQFYRSVDVFIVASRHEGEPLTLIEAMACGCFPVCTDVGIVPELIQHGRNGYIVRERTVAAFQNAFAWCQSHCDEVRIAGRANAALIARNRNWALCARSFARVYWNAIAWANRA
jgi:hypothetical protein